MNPLQTHSHLFANGMFRVQYKVPDYDSEILGVIDGIKNNTTLINGCEEVHIKDNEAKLVARSIEDMTDEELENCKRVWKTLGYKDHVGGREFLKDKANGIGLNINDALYLLSIGVYPFDQSHFGDTVIDTRTLTNA